MNKIKNIIFCYDEHDTDKILGIAVFREYSIEKCTFEKDWERLVNELIKTYPEDIEGLDLDAESSSDEVVRRFQENKRIKVVNGDVIVSLTKYKGEKDADNKLEVKYASGKIVRINRTSFPDESSYLRKINECIVSFCDTYGYDATNPSDLALFKINGFIKEVEHREIEKEPKSSGEATPTVSNINYKKILSLIMAGMIATVGSFVYCKSYSKKFVKVVPTKEPVSNNEITFDFPTPTPTPLATENVLHFSTPETTPVPAATRIPVSTRKPTAKPVRTLSPTRVPTKKPTATPIVTKTPSPTAVPVITPTIEPTMTPRPYNPAPTNFPIEMVNPRDTTLVLRLMTEDLDALLSFDDLLSDNAEINDTLYDSSYLDFKFLAEEISDYEVSLLSNYVYDEEPLPDQAHLIYFENFFTNNRVDYEFIKYFSDLRNEVVYQLYRNNDIDRAKECNKFAIYQLLRCYLNNEPLSLSINGQMYDVRISDLSSVAKKDLREIAYAFYIMQGNTKVIFNDKEYDYMTFGNEVFNLPIEEELGKSY